MRYIVVPAVWALFGLFLVVGSLYTVPYNVREQFRVDREKTWIDEAFVLLPSVNETFTLDSIGENASIFQVDVHSSGLVAYKIVAYATGKVWFELEGREDFTSYWTPPLGYGIWRFVFHNPSLGSVNVTAKVTEFYLKITEDKVVTHYRPMLDAVYGYLGIGLVIVSVVLNLVYVSRPQKEIR